MTERLALLAAILAAPDDDLPRLVFADWLEENGTTDAEAARVEFIRLGCKSKAKSRISPGETKWLDANWQRLLGTTVAATHPKTRRQRTTREGRFVRLHFRWQDVQRVGIAEVVFEYVRGFARRVEYLQGHTYQRFWQAVATDEPIAYHRPEARPQEYTGPSGRDWHARLLPGTWGDDVFQRALGFDELGPVGDKVYRHWPQGKAKGERGRLSVTESVSGFDPLAVADEHGLDPGHHRQRAAVATAMTALAREFVGLGSGL